MSDDDTEDEYHGHVYFDAVKTIATFIGRRVHRWCDGGQAARSVLYERAKGTRRTRLLIRGRAGPSVKDESTRMISTELGMNGNARHEEERMESFDERAAELRQQWNDEHW